MRKFTKILTRRLNNKDHHQPTSETTTPTLYESPCFHQLSSSRLLAQHAAAARTPLNGLSSTQLVADEAPELMCATCSGIDFPHLLDWRPGKSRPWVNLSHVLEGQDEPRCPYCAFFRVLLGGGGAQQTGSSSEPQGRGASGNFAPYFRIRLAFERLGVGERHALGKAVLIEVMARNKSLPWGYIIKAAEEDGASAKGYLGKEEVTSIRARMIAPLFDPTLARTWIDYCDEHHAQGEHMCASKTRDPPITGLRLIDVEKRRIVSVDNDGPDPSPEYVALSYVWGERSPGTNADVDDQKILPDDIPPLIADAINFTKTIGYRYLWVDQYCFFTLPQDAQRHQISLIGDIFSQSSLTLIVAAGDTTASDGIPGVSALRMPQPSLKTDTGLFVTTLLRPDHEVAGSAWAARAWTYQEGLLAQRRLVFTSSQVYFQCGSLHCQESISVPLSLAPGLNLGRVFPETRGGMAVQHFGNHVKTFLTKELSHPEDRLDAFQGMLRHYSTSSETPVKSFLGLPLCSSGAPPFERISSPTDRLVIALGWLPGRTLPTQPAVPDTPYILDGARVFPSWTWLAWRLQPTSTHLNHSFNFTLTNPANELCAPPRTSTSIRFKDGAVLNWETEGEAIDAKPESDVHFLRITSYTFTLVVRKIGETVSMAGVNLNRTQRDAIKGWFRAEATEAPDGEYEVMAVVLSGRNWKTPGDKEATIMACRLDPWSQIDVNDAGDTLGIKLENVLLQDEESSTPNEVADSAREPTTSSDANPNRTGKESKLVRLGALTVSYTDFTPVDDETAVMEGVELDGGDRGDITLSIREVDIY